MPALLSYTDRFGHRWRVRCSQTPDGDWTLAFASAGVRLVGSGTTATPLSAMSPEDLKECFCDAERVLVSGGVRWFVGYRRRTFGRRSTPQGGLCTRFRSEAGDVRFSHVMLDFRHMPTSALREHLVAILRRNGRAASHGRDSNHQQLEV